MSRRLWVGTLGLALALRLLLLAAPSSPVDRKVVLAISDAQEYERLARNLVVRHAFTQDSIPPLEPETFRTPAYPIFLAPWYALDSRPLVLVVLVQTLLSLGLVAATFRLARELRGRPAEAAAAALLVAVSPNLAFIATKEVTETLFTFLLVLDLWLLNRYRMTGWIPALAAAGVGCGILVLTRPIASFFPLCLAALVLWERSGGRAGADEQRDPGRGRGRDEPARRSWRRALAGAALFLAASTVTIAPWIIRNGAQTGRYIVSTASERNLSLYNAPTVLASRERISIEQAHDRIATEGLAEQGGIEGADEAHFWLGRSKVARRYVLRYPLTTAKVQMIGFVSDFAVPISLHPLLTHCGADVDVSRTADRMVMQETVAGVSGGRLRAIWRRLWEERFSRLPLFGLVLLLYSACYLAALLLLALIGFLRGRELRWLLLPILYFTLLTGPVGDARFRAPIEPLLAILAGTGFVWIRNRGRQPAADRR